MSLPRTQCHPGARLPSAKAEGHRDPWLRLLRGFERAHAGRPRPTVTITASGPVGPGDKPRDDREGKRATELGR